jgi:hypothetical protein
MAIKVINILHSKTLHFLPKLVLKIYHLTTLIRTAKNLKFKSFLERLIFQSDGIKVRTDAKFVQQNIQKHEQTFTRGPLPVAFSGANPAIASRVTR